MTAPLLRAPVAVREADLRDDREAARIDRFVRAAPGATPFHLPAWSRAVETGCRQRARYLVAERADGGLAGVLPLTEMRSALFGRALVSAGFAVGGGPLGDAAPLVSSAVELAGRCGCGVELRGGEAPAGWAVDAVTYEGFARGLAASEAAELAAIPRKQRAEVRRAATMDLTVEHGCDAAALAAHYAVYAESVRDLGTPVFPRALLAAVAEGMDAEVTTVRYAGRAVASVLSLYFAGTVYPYWGGGTRAARALRANDWLYWSVMARARARGCTRFDFGRSKAGTGAAAYKRHWGFAPEPLRYSHWGGAPRAVNPLDRRYAALVAGWRRLPLAVANRLGPAIARGLG